MFRAAEVKLLFVPQSTIKRLVGQYVLPGDGFIYCPVTQGHGAC